MKKKLLIISNCQGPTLFGRFIKNYYPDFSEKFELLPYLQVQLLKPADNQRVMDLIGQADIVCAQPVLASGCDPVKHVNLVDICKNAGKELILFPAMHFDCLFPGVKRTAWAGTVVPPYPFGQNEDLVLASCFLCDATPQQASQVYHQFAFLNAKSLNAAIAENINEFVSRETQHCLDIRISDFYEATWRNRRLHYVKSHPLRDAYDEMAKRFAVRLELGESKDPDTLNLLGNNQFSMPIKAWTKELLQLSFADDPDVALFNNQEIPFEELIRIIFDFYSANGKDEVMQVLKLKDSKLLAGVRQFMS